LCAKEGKRLCSRDEWQSACKGQRDYNYPYGNEYVKGMCSDQSAEGGAGQYPSGAMAACVSGYGVSDMSGNLWEWTSDVYDDGTRGIQGGSAATNGADALSCGAPPRRNPTRLTTTSASGAAAPSPRRRQEPDFAARRLPPIHGEEPGFECGRGICKHEQRRQFRRSGHLPERHRMEPDRELSVRGFPARFHTHGL